MHPSRAMRASIESSFSKRSLFMLWLVVYFLAVPLAVAQENQDQEKDNEEKTVKEKTVEIPKKLSRLPIEWLIGPYIPIQRQLYPLTLRHREEIYERQTFLTFGSYLARGFSAGIDQTRGDPSKWGWGISGYGKRYATRYGQFVVQNSLVATGNAALGYEPRYDFCRCDGFWPRTRHAISRNFVAYDRSETELRPQIPTYAGAFAAGVLRASWLPGHPSLVKGGVYSVLSQAAIGSGYDFVSEFSLDILHKFRASRKVKRNGVMFP